MLEKRIYTADDFTDCISTIKPYINRNEDYILSQIPKIMPLYAMKKIELYGVCFSDENFDKLRRICTKAAYVSDYIKLHDYFMEFVEVYLEDIAPVDFYNPDEKRREKEIFYGEDDYYYYFEGNLENAVIDVFSNWVFRMSRENLRNDVRLNK